MTSFKEICPICNAECIGKDDYAGYCLMESNWRCPTGHYFDEWAYGFGKTWINLDSKELEIYTDHDDTEETMARKESEIENFINAWYDKHEDDKCVK